MHENKINNMRYIGITYHKDPTKRWLNNGMGYKNQYFYTAIEEFGWDNFNHIILERNVSEELIQSREDYWIDKYNTMDPQYGYNRVKSTGVSEETRKCMSENWDSKDSLRRTKQSALMTALNQKIDRTGSNNPMYDTHRTGKDAARKRSVRCIETGEIFETMTDASKWCNPNGCNLRSKIALQIKGERKSCGKHPETGIPLHWEYVYPDLNNG